MSSSIRLLTFNIYFSKTSLLPISSRINLFMMFYLQLSILFFVQFYFLNKSNHIMYISYESYDLFTIVTTKSSKQVPFHIYYMSQDSRVIILTIHIIFLKLNIVLMILVIFLIQVTVFSMYF